MRVAVSGYYGCGNTGDEAVLAGILESFARRTPNQSVEFTVLSADPADTERRHGVKAVPRMSPAIVRQTLRESDMLLSGGGSLLQDTTSLKSLLYYLWVARLGRSCGTPVMFYAQGIGPLRRPIARTLTRIIANGVQAITVRDEESARLLKRIGVRKPPIEVTADPAFALTPDEPDKVAAILERAGAAMGQPLIGFALRPWKGPSPTIEQYARMADEAASKTDADVLFVPMQPPGDVELSRQIAAKMSAKAYVIEEPLSPRGAAGVLAALKGLVGMRLHALILGAAAGLPMVALSYDPKVDQLMDRLGQRERNLAIDRCAAEQVAESVAGAIAEGDSLRDSLRCRAAAMSESALVNVDRALALVRA